MSKINVKRTESMKKKTDAELQAIIKSGSLSAAAAEYEFFKRRKGALSKQD